MLQERQTYINTEYIARHHTLDETITCRSQELRALLGNLNEYNFYSLDSRQ